MPDRNNTAVTSHILPLCSMPKGRLPVLQHRQLSSIVPLSAPPLKTTNHRHTPKHAQTPTSPHRYPNGEINGPPQRNILHRQVTPDRFPPYGSAFFRRYCGRIESEKSTRHVNSPKKGPCREKAEQHRRRGKQHRPQTTPVL